jgi:hypothetical protein
MGTDLSTLVMFATASKDIAVGHLGPLREAVVFVPAFAITLVTAWAPPLLYSLNPAFTVRLLSPLGEAVRQRGRTLAVLLLSAVGLYLLVRGAVGLA